MRLHEAGFTNLVGVDYSAKAIELANSIKAQNDAMDIKFETCDILSDTAPLTEQHTYRIVLDKGTYDAICLSRDADIGDLRAKYIKAISELMHSDGHFILTSCNWTKDELLGHFTARGAFVYDTELLTKSIQFGGVRGQNITCLIFTRNKVA